MSSDNPAAKGLNPVEAAPVSTVTPVVDESGITTPLNDNKPFATTSADGNTFGTGVAAEPLSTPSTPKSDGPIKGETEQDGGASTSEVTKTDLTHIDTGIDDYNDGTFHEPTVREAVVHPDVEAELQSFQNARSIAVKESDVDVAAFDSYVQERIDELIKRDDINSSSDLQKQTALDQDLMYKLASDEMGIKLTPAFMKAQVSNTSASS